MMKWMTELMPTMGFDCASEREIREVMDVLEGNNAVKAAQKIIYAQPCKKLEDIHIAQAKGIKTTVADSVEELLKLGNAKWNGSVLIRLLVDDAGSKQPFGKKFGAPIEWLSEMFQVAKVHNLNMTGFSFHVGSECEDPKQYYNAIAKTAEAATTARKYGFKTQMIDIGGGFLPYESSFAAIATQVKASRTRFFGSLYGKGVSFIAEPGRFLASPTHTLYTPVIGKKPMYPPPKTENDPAWRITIDESVYGAFSNIPFDGQKPVIERLRAADKNEKQRPTTIFGRTCDSGDTIGTHVPMYDVQEGDVLVARNMGAYTTVTASEFNGFPKAKKVYEMC